MYSDNIINNNREIVYLIDPLLSCVSFVRCKKKKNIIVFYYFAFINFSIMEDNVIDNKISEVEKSLSTRFRNYLHINAYSLFKILGEYLYSKV